MRVPDEVTRSVVRTLRSGSSRSLSRRARVFVVVVARTAGVGFGDWAKAFALIAQNRRQANGRLEIMISRGILTSFLLRVIMRPESTRLFSFGKLMLRNVKGVQGRSLTVAVPNSGLAGLGVYFQQCGAVGISAAERREAEQITGSQVSRICKIVQTKRDGGRRGIPEHADVAENYFGSQAKVYTEVI